MCSPYVREQSMWIPPVVFTVCSRAVNEDTPCCVHRMFASSQCGYPLLCSPYVREQSMWIRPVVLTVCSRAVNEDIPCCAHRMFASSQCGYPLLCSPYVREQSMRTPPVVLTVCSRAVNEILFGQRHQATSLAKELSFQRTDCRKGPAGGAVFLQTAGTILIFFVTKHDRHLKRNVNSHSA